MKKLLILIIIPFLSFGQGWEQTYSDFLGSSIKQTSDGGYIIAGGAFFASGGLTKLNSEGVIMWANEDIKGYSVQQTLDGGYIVTGQYYCEDLNSTGEGDICLTKTDGDGNVQWSRSFSGGDNSGEGGEDVLQTSDGGYVLCGFINKMPPNPNTDVVIIKTNYNGDEEWLELYDDGSNSSATGLSIEIVDGGYIVGGWCSANGHLIKVNENGEEQWSQCYDELSSATPSVQQTFDGGYLIGSRYNPGYYDANLKILKTDENGNVDWINGFENTGLIGCHSIEKTNDGGYIICGGTGMFGYEYENSVENHIYILKTNENAEEEWYQTYGEQFDMSIGLFCEQTNDGGYVVIGAGINVENDDWNAIIIKTNEFGNITSTIEYPAINKTLIKTLDILGRESTNKGLQLHIYNDGSVEKKYVIK